MVEEVVKQQSENLFGGVSPDKQTHPYFKFEDATYAALKEYINVQRTFGPQTLLGCFLAEDGKSRSRTAHYPDETNRDQLVYMKINNNHFLAKQVNRERPPVQISTSTYAQSTPAPSTQPASSSGNAVAGSGPFLLEAVLRWQRNRPMASAMLWWRLILASNVYMHVVWDDSTTGANVPEGYLLLAGRTVNFILPVNGVPIQDNTKYVPGTGRREHSLQ